MTDLPNYCVSCGYPLKWGEWKKVEAPMSGTETEVRYLECTNKPQTACPGFGFINREKEWRDGERS